MIPISWGICDSYKRGGFVIPISWGICDSYKLGDL